MVKQIAQIAQLNNERRMQRVNKDACRLITAGSFLTIQINCLSVSIVLNTETYAFSQHYQKIAQKGTLGMMKQGEEYEKQ